MNVSHFKTAGIIVPIAAIILCFQNCAPAKFAASTASSKAEGAFDDDVVTTPDEVDPTIPSPVSTPVVMPTEPSDRSDDVDCKTPQEREEVKKYRKTCEEFFLKKKGVLVADGLSFEDQSGIMNYRANSFNRIENNSGIRVLGAASDKGGAIESLSNNSGISVVCGLDVKKVHGNSGIVVVVDGNIGSVQGGSGVIVVGGKIEGGVSGHSGIIREYKKR